MSYTIFYRSLFVKTRDNKFIPIIESGDNNVWECDNKRRARDWHNSGWITGKDEYLQTAESIMGKVERMIQSVKEQYVGELTDSWDENCTTRWTEQDVEQRFGYFEGLAISGNGHCNNTTAQQVRNFYKRGIERAIPIEDVLLDVHWCTEYPHYEHRYTHSEEELLAAIMEGLDAGHQPWVGFGRWDVERILDRQAAERKMQRKPSAPKDTAFVVKIGYRWVSQMSSRRVWHNSWMEYAKRYATRRAAEKVAERIRTHYDSITAEPEVLAVRRNEEGKWELAA